MLTDRQTDRQTKSQTYTTDKEYHLRCAIGNNVGLRAQAVDPCRPTRILYKIASQLLVNVD